MPRFVLLSLALLALGAVLAAPASAQVTNTYKLSGLVGFGGSVDNDESGLGNMALQFGFAVAVEDHLDVGVRVGTISYDEGDQLGRIFDPSFEYLAFAGEYSFPDFYNSGIFIGLGYYETSGTRFIFNDDNTVDAVGESLNTVGLALGSSGEWQLNPRSAIVSELSVHVLPGEDSEYFATLMFGVQFGF